MVVISCSGKFHAFALAEQLKKNNMLDKLYTTYAYQKNTFFRKFVKRIDKENLLPNEICTNIPLAFPIKLINSKVHIWNNLYDKWVARKLKHSNAKVFIGWSGMCLHSLRAAKKSGMITIVERGSAHILYQNKILKEEYNNFGLEFNIHPKVIEKELQEYIEADFISIPSSFSLNSFIEYGIDIKKLFINAYGVSNYFSSIERSEKSSKFSIIYLGSLTIQKGVIYLFQALSSLSINEKDIDVYFIGKIDDEIKDSISKYKKDNWFFLGHINQYELHNYLNICDIAVHPSIQDGFAMVIPQMLACGIPVITTTNTAADDIVINDYNGYVIPIRSPESIADKINYLYKNPEILEALVPESLPTPRLPRHPLAVRHHFKLASKRRVWRTH